MLGSLRSRLTTTTSWCRPTTSRICPRARPRRTRASSRAPGSARCLELASALVGASCWADTQRSPDTQNDASRFFLAQANVAQMRAPPHGPGHGGLPLAARADPTRWRIARGLACGAPDGRRRRDRDPRVRRSAAAVQHVVWESLAALHAYVYPERTRRPVARQAAPGSTRSGGAEPRALVDSRGVTRRRLRRRARRLDLLRELSDRPPRRSRSASRSPRPAPSRRAQPEVDARSSARGARLSAEVHSRPRRRDGCRLLAKPDRALRARPERDVPDRARRGRPLRLREAPALTSRRPAPPPPVSDSQRRAHRRLHVRDPRLADERRPGRPRRRGFFVLRRLPPASASDAALRFCSGTPAGILGSCASPRATAPASRSGTRSSASTRTAPATQRSGPGVRTRGACSRSRVEGGNSMTVAKQHLSPAGLFSTKGLGFTHVVTSAPSITVYVSGQTAWSAERKLVGGNDLRLQARAALGNLRTALAAGEGPRRRSSRTSSGTASPIPRACSSRT